MLMKYLMYGMLTITRQIVEYTVATDFNLDVHLYQTEAYFQWEKVFSLDIEIKHEYRCALNFGKHS